MTATGGQGADAWVVHRPNVVRSVAARVPGIDAEEATSRALEKMVRIVSTGATIEQPAPYWRRAAVNEAISMTREAGRTHAVEDDTLADLTPPIAGAELDAERHADVRMLRTALADLADDDRQILLDRHVHDRAVTDIATGLGVRPHAVTMRLRRAEERLAGAFAAAHAHTVNEPECRTTRAAMHDYLKGRLLPRRQRRLEVHMDSCAECTRAFVDVREVSWMLRDLGQHVVAGAVATGGVGGVAGAGVVAGAGSVGTRGVRPRNVGAREITVAASVAAVLVLGGAAAAYLSNQSEQPPAQAVDLGAGGTAVEPLPAPDLPSAAPSHSPAPRPAASPAAEPTRAPQPTAAPKPGPVPVIEPARTPRTEPEPEPDDAGPAPAPAVVAPEPERPDPPKAEPAPTPEKPVNTPTPEPEPEPETPPEQEPPAEPLSGPPGNPDNENGKGPTKDNNQGPGNGNGQDNGTANGNGHGAGNGKGRSSHSTPGNEPEPSEPVTTLIAVPSLPGVVGSSGVLLLTVRPRRWRR